MSWGWKHSAPVRLPHLPSSSSPRASDSPRLQIARATTQREQSIPILLSHFRSSCHLVRQFFLARKGCQSFGERVSENESERREESVDDKRALRDWEDCLPSERASKGVTQLRGSKLKGARDRRRPTSFQQERDRGHSRLFSLLNSPLRKLAAHFSPHRLPIPSTPYKLICCPLLNPKNLSPAFLPPLPFLRYQIFD